MISLDLKIHYLNRIAVNARHSLLYLSHQNKDLDFYSCIHLLNQSVEDYVRVDPNLQVQERADLTALLRIIAKDAALNSWTGALQTIQDCAFRLLLQANYQKTKEERAAGILTSRSEDLLSRVSFVEGLNWAARQEKEARSFQMDKRAGDYS